MSDDDRVVITFPRPLSRRHIPNADTRALVLRAAGLGLTHEQIAVLLRVSVVTVEKHYKVELKSAEALLNFNVAQNLYSIATNPEHKGAVTAAIFWMKTRGKWREVQRHEHTGEGGGPIQHQVVAAETINVRTLTAEQRDALRETLIEALAQRPQLEAPRDQAVDVEFEDVEVPAGAPNDGEDDA